MKLSTLALIAATVALPATAFAEGVQNSAPGAAKTGAADSSIPGATNPNGSMAKPRAGTTGAGAADSSVPGATNPNTSNAKAKSGTTGAGAGDSSIPGASNSNMNKPK